MTRKWIDKSSSSQVGRNFRACNWDEYAAEVKVLSQDVGFTTRSWVIWYTRSV